MPIFTLDNSRMPPTPRQSTPIATQESRTVALVGITVVVIIVALAASAFLFIKNYVGKFVALDDSQSSLTVGEIQTVYTNPKYGVTLTLPGKWQKVFLQYRTLCNLSDGKGLFAMFSPMFPAPSATVDQDAEILKQSYLNRNHLKLVSDSRIEINGRAARIMRFQTNSGRDLELAVVKKWPVLYTLVITGPRESSEWSGLTDALPKSIEVK